MKLPQLGRRAIKASAGVSKTALRVMFPFDSIRQTTHLARQEARRTLDNLHLLKDMGKQARQAVTTGISEDRRKNESFAAAMNRCNSQARLRQQFLFKKRCAIGVAFFFALMALLTFASGLHHASTRSVVLSLLCLAASQPLLFILALGTQLRLWQLETGRLSIEEQGGLKDFMRAHPCWWCITLNPELGARRSPQKDAP
jgi:hypothetical protein